MSTKEIDSKLSFLIRKGVGFAMLNSQRDCATAT